MNAVVGHKEKAEDLGRLLDQLGPADRKFADSLLNGPSGFRAKGQFSEKQEYWVDTLIRRAITGTKAEQVGVKVGVPDALIKRFEFAGDKLKYPRLMMLIPSVGLLSVSLCGEKSMYKGDWHLKNPESQQYWGRLSRSGEYHPSGLARQMPVEWKRAMMQVLQGLASDPDSLLSQFGKALGNCCFCWGKLETPESLHFGYGPVCAKNWGLPWGKV